MSPNFKNIRPSRSSNTPPKGPPLINPTGNAKVDLLADVLNRTADAWKQTPPPEQGVCGVIAAGVGAALKTFGAPFELLDVGFAAMTADLAAMMPPMAAATISPLTFGLTIPHAHAHPPTFGVPAPGFGSLIFGGSFSVAINGEPAARAGDLGLAPTCCGFAPAFEVFTGSSNTFIGGSRAARQLDIIRQCDPTLALGVIGKVMGAAGMVAGAAQAGAEHAAGKAQAAQVAAMQAAADAIALGVAATLGKDPGAPPGVGAICNGSADVFIGGLPVPDVLSMLNGLMKLGKLGKKLAKGKLKSKKPKSRCAQQKCNNPGEPVDPVTGAVFNQFVDFEDPTAGLKWDRWYRSAWNLERGCLGPGFRHCLDKRLVFYRTRCAFVDFNGDEIDFPCIDDDGDRFEGVEGGSRLVQTSDSSFELLRGTDEILEFRTDSVRLRWSQARLVRWRTAALDLRITYGSDDLLHRVHEHGRAVGDGSQTHELAFEHDRRGLLRKVTRVLAGSRSTTIARYDYDDGGRLVEHVDVLGAVRCYAFDRESRMTRYTTRGGYSFHWAYDALGRCVETHGEDGLYQCRFVYESGRTFVTKADGGEWGYTFDPHGRIEAIVDPYGGVKRWEFDNDGRIATQVDATGVRTLWRYDSTGRHTGRVDAFGAWLPPEDDAPNARVARENEPPTSALGWHVGRSMGAHGSAAVLRVPASVQPLVEAVWRGQTPATFLAVPASVDAAGRIATRFDASGASESWRRDAEGNPLQHTDLDGATYRREFTSWNLETTSQDPGGRVTQILYDAETHRVAFTDPGGTVTEYPRDLRGRIDRVVRAGRVRERYEYDLGDHLIAKYDAEQGLLCSYDIDERGLCDKRTLRSGEVITYTFDARGRICGSTVTSPDAQACVVERDHDLRGLVCADRRDGQGIEHRSAGGARYSVAFGRFETTTRPRAAGEWSVATPDGVCHDFGHHALGFVLAELGNGTRELACFGVHERCAGKLRWRSPDSIDAVVEGSERWVRYDYSPEGELRTASDSERGTSRYAYDQSHRLVREHDETGVDEQWEYDGAGNLATIPGLGWVRYEPGNRLRSVAGERFTYDARDNLIEVVRAEGAWTRFTYDSLDNLVGIAWSNRDEVWAAGYDGLGRRTHKTYGSRRTEYYWDDDRLAAEVAPDGRLRLYVYATADAFVPFLFLDYDSVHAEPDSGAAHYIFTNQIGAPERIEDAAGAVVWRVERYKAYGEIVLAAAATIECNLRWPGHFFDPETGLHYNRYRYYSPRLGRYIQSDPVGAAGGLNTHAGPTNPVAMVDVLGLTPCTTKAKPGDGSGGKKTKPDAESDAPAMLSRASADEVALAASGSTSRAAKRARMRAVKAFLAEHSRAWDHKEQKLRKLTSKEISDQLEGHDLARPVVVGPPPSPPPGLYQRQQKGGRQGSYYSDQDVRPTEVGIAGVTRGKDGRYEGKESTGYDVDPNAPYMKSTAAPALDTWSMPDQPTQTRGGGDQYLIPDRARATPMLGDN